MTNSDTREVKLSELLAGKVVVADTSSLLIAGTALLTAIEDCTLVIPAIVVKELEEKRTHSTLGFLAREWLRLLEEIRSEHGKALASGVELKKYNITLQVEPNHRSQESLPSHLQDHSHDSTILAVAKNLSDELKEKQNDDNIVVLLSNDVPMRIHATLDLDIEAHEFSAGAIAPSEPFYGVYEVNLSDEEYSEDYKNIETLVLSKLPEDAAKNAYVKVRVGNDPTALSYILMNGEVKKLSRKTRVSEIVARTEEQDVALEYLRKPVSDVSIVSLHGRAGSGKTLLTVASAISELKNGKYQKIIAFRSLHELGEGQEMGFLPGTVEEKMSAWAGAINDSIDVIAAAKKPPKKNEGIHAETNRQKIADDLRAMIEISPITYLRGRSLSNTFIILEEAQNFSRSEILNILSRAGEGSKIVLTFDDAQVDNRFLQTGSKADIWSVIESLKMEELFAHITFKKTERSKVAEIASRLLMDK